MDLRKVVAVIFILLTLAIGVGLYQTASDVGNSQTHPEQPNNENADFDNDTLSNSYEREIGTSPYTADTDGDGLLDNWEVENSSSPKKLPGSDPLHKDIYLQINYADNVTHLKASELERLKYYWSEMPVSNPDGTDGIKLHVDDSPPGGGDIPTNLSVEGYGVKSISYMELRNLSKSYYGGEGNVTGNISQNRRCAYHQMILVQSEFPYNKGSNFTYILGKGIPGGKFSVVMGDSERGTIMIGPKSPSRLDVMTHELLHNVAGGYHTETSSWLAPTTPMMSPSLSNKTKEKLENDGFATNSCS